MCPFSKNANEVKTLNVGKFQFQIPSVICVFFPDRKVVTSSALRLVGMPTTSQILTGDSQMLSFSILTKVPFLIF